MDPPRPPLHILLIRYLGLSTREGGIPRWFLFLCAVPVAFFAATFFVPLLVTAWLVIYATVFSVYLVYSDVSPVPLLWHPFAALRVFRTALSQVRDFLAGPFPAGLKHVLRTLSGSEKTRLKIARDVNYAGSYAMDVYPCREGFPLPRERTLRPGKDELKYSPVLVIVHGGMWRSGDKGIYAPAAKWWRARGFVVVVANYGVFPKAKLAGQLSSLRSLLSSVHDRIRVYGGQPSRMFVMAADSGAHLLLLSLLLDIEASLNPVVSGPGSPGRDSGAESSSSNPRRRSSLLPRSTPRLPPIKGLILLAGVYDTVFQNSWDSERGWSDVSALRRVLGPDLVAASPIHRLQALIPQSPPALFPKTWIIHGTKDELTPLSGAVEFARLLRKWLGSSTDAEDRVKTTWLDAGHFELIAGGTFDTSPLAGEIEEGMELFIGPELSDEEGAN